MVQLQKVNNVVKLCARAFCDGFIEAPTSPFDYSPYKHDETRGGARNGVLNSVGEILADVQIRAGVELEQLRRQAASESVTAVDKSTNHVD